MSSFRQQCFVWYQIWWVDVRPCRDILRLFFHFDISLKRLAGLLNDNSIISDVMWDLFGRKTEAESRGNVMRLSGWAARYSSGDLCGLCELALPMQIWLETSSLLSFLFILASEVFHLCSITWCSLGPWLSSSIWCRKDSLKGAADPIQHGVIWWGHVSFTEIDRHTGHSFFTEA